MFDYDAHHENSFSLNSSVKYKPNFLEIEDFANAGVYNHYQLRDDNSNCLCFNDFAQKYNLKSESKLFLKYVKFYFSICKK